MSEVTLPAPDDLIVAGLSLSAPAQVNRSAWTGSRQVIGLPGAELWSATVGVELISTEAEERKWRAFLFGLRGPINWFRLPLPCAAHPGAKPTVASGATGGRTLPLTGLQPNTTILEAGQYMTVPLPSGHARAVMLTVDLVSNGSGVALATFVPVLGETPAGGVTVETKDPYIPVSLTDPRQAIAMQSGVSTLSFDVDEAR